MSYGPEVFRKYLDILDEKSQVNEGTWGYPESDADVAELKELLKQPIPLGPGGEDAMAVLGRYFGDDDLYDALGVAGDKNPEGDANLIFKDWMERRIQDNDYGLGPETKEIYDQIYGDEVNEAPQMTPAMKNQHDAGKAAMMVGGQALNKTLGSKGAKNLPGVTPQVQAQANKNAAEIQAAMDKAKATPGAGVGASLRGRDVNKTYGGEDGADLDNLGGTLRGKK